MDADLIALWNDPTYASKAAAIIAKADADYAAHEANRRPRRTAVGVMAGPRSDAVLVNIILHNQLEPLLRTWLSTDWDAELGKNGPVSHDEITNRINTLIAAEAAKSGAPPVVCARPTIHRWIYEVYKIGDPPKPRKRRT